MSERVPMTRAGYNKLKAEIDELQNVQMPEIEKRIGAARAEGDLSENAEYHGARESQGLLQAKINMLKDKLARASIMDFAKVPKDQVAFGCTIVVKDLDFGDQEEFTLVGAGEEDYDTGRINVVSPTLLTESVSSFGALFPGAKTVSTARVARAYQRSVEGAQTGRTYRVM